MSYKKLLIFNKKSILQGVVFLSLVQLCYPSLVWSLNKEDDDLLYEYYQQDKAVEKLEARIASDERDRAKNRRSFSTLRRTMSGSLGFDNTNSKLEIDHQVYKAAKESLEVGRQELANTMVTRQKLRSQLVERLGPNWESEYKKFSSDTSPHGRIARAAERDSEYNSDDSSDDGYSDDDDDKLHRHVRKGGKKRRTKELSEMGDEEQHHIEAKAKKKAKDELAQCVEKYGNFPGLTLSDNILKKGRDDKAALAKLQNCLNQYNSALKKLNKKLGRSQENRLRDIDSFSDTTSENSSVGSGGSFSYSSGSLDEEWSFEDEDSSSGRSRKQKRVRFASLTDQCSPGATAFFNELGIPEEEHQLFLDFIKILRAGKLDGDEKMRELIALFEGRGSDTLSDASSDLASISGSEDEDPAMLVSSRWQALLSKLKNLIPNSLLSRLMSLIKTPEKIPEPILKSEGSRRKSRALTGKNDSDLSAKEKAHQSTMQLVGDVEDLVKKLGGNIDEKGRKELATLLKGKAGVERDHKILEQLNDKYGIGYKDSMPWLLSLNLVNDVQDLIDPKAKSSRRVKFADKVSNELSSEDRKNLITELARIKSDAQRREKLGKFLQTRGILEEKFNDLMEISDYHLPLMRIKNFQDINPLVEEMYNFSREKGSEIDEKMLKEFYKSLKELILKRPEPGDEIGYRAVFNFLTKRKNLPADDVIEWLDSLRNEKGPSLPPRPRPPAPGLGGAGAAAPNGNGWKDNIDLFLKEVRQFSKEKNKELSEDEVRFIRSKLVTMDSDYRLQAVYDYLEHGKKIDRSAIDEWRFGLLSRTPATGNEEEKDILSLLVKARQFSKERNKELSDQQVEFLFRRIKHKGSASGIEELSDYFTKWGIHPDEILQWRFNLLKGNPAQSPRTTR